MAKRVIWSRRAQRNRKEILKYWSARNGSNLYSKKLDRLFRESIRIIARFPHIGLPTDQANIRIKTAKEYFVVYEETDLEVVILAIWDSRQNPNDLKPQRAQERSVRSWQS